MQLSLPFFQLTYSYTSLSFSIFMYISRHFFKGIFLSPPAERTVRIRKVEGSIPFMSTKITLCHPAWSYFYFEGECIISAQAYALSGGLRK